MTLIALKAFNSPGFKPVPQPTRNGLLAVGLFAFALFPGCASSQPKPDAVPLEIRTADYDLIIPARQKALLILFPCFSCDAADTRSESKITDEAVANGISVMLMNFNRHLMLNEAEQQGLIDTIAQAIRANGLHAENTFIGGFSSGGNVSVLLAKALVHGQRTIQLKGVFAVDSPLDLSHLYASSQRRVERPSFPDYKGEARMVVALLNDALGDPATHPDAYEARSPLYRTPKSLLPLKDLPIRFYTEPDTAWWRLNRGDSYEDMNAYSLEQLHAQLVAAGNDQAELIRTQDRGFQHGHRHPHAWSIVDERELVRWIDKLSKEH